ncbi:MAG: DUF1987 domain-containing protein [Bacteroidales bacterium]
MEFLNIDATQDTPAVLFDRDTNTFIISGRSYPENAFMFYKRLMEWMEVYVKEANEVTVLVIKLEYYNTATSKQLFKIFLLLEELNKSSKKVKIQWYYKTNDADHKLQGELFAKVINIPFEYFSF